MSQKFSLKFSRHELLGHLCMQMTKETAYLLGDTCNDQRVSGARLERCSRRKPADPGGGRGWSSSPPRAAPSRRPMASQIASSAPSSRKISLPRNSPSCPGARRKPETCPTCARPPATSGRDLWTQERVPASCCWPAHELVASRPLGGGDPGPPATNPSLFRRRVAVLYAPLVTGLVIVT